ncbi:hypothetical protein M1M30_gp131 [Maribacter phage Colly_1]|uniref:Uncharacterized protein n=1 Tax=Maribacter phage Colly_1 TaxID=2745691 RepID=A0A8E4UXT6_9CAUD|nr:hypothetical protein M1M30_gp131 [Maribacter phage Colly_1]QQO97231.1 hypothetical protein Colly1_131 [Maribacter phage Colly_1]
MADESKEIKPFKPEDLMDGVRAKIKSTFVDLIPEEAWDAMVKAEVNSFMSPKSYNNYNRTEQVSNFQFVIRDVLTEATREKCKELLNDPEFSSGMWQNGTEQPSQFIKQFMLDNANELMMGMFGSMFQQALTIARTQNGY